MPKENKNEKKEELVKDAEKVVEKKPVEKESETAKPKNEFTLPPINVRVNVDKQ